MAYSITIEEQPTAAFIPAYRPIVFHIEAHSDTDDDADIVSIRADIYKDGVFLVAQRVNFPQFSINGTDKQYDVYFDIQQTVQDSFDTEFLNCQHSNFYCIFTPERYNPGSKYLEEIDQDVQSNTFFAVNSTLQHYQVQDLDAFYGDGFKFTSNAPNVVTSGLTAYRAKKTNRRVKEYLSFLFQNGSATTFDTVVTFYDEKGTPLGTETITSSTSHNGKDFIPVDVSLSALDPDNDYPESRFYTVQIEYGSVTSEKRLYEVVGCDPERTIHFMNQYGGYDTYNFMQSMEEDYTTKSDEFERPLPMTFNRQARGFAAFQIQDNSEFKLTVSGLDKKWLEWLKELQSSADVYYEAQIGGQRQFIPATIKDSTNMIYNSGKSQGVFAISLVPSNEGIRQRN